jgi:hypothetical protein
MQQTCDMRNAYKILFGKHEKMRVLGTPRSAGMWEDNIKLISNKYNVRAWSARCLTGGALRLAPYSTAVRIVLHRTRGIYPQDEQLPASKDELFSVKLVTLSIYLYYDVDYGPHSCCWVAINTIWLSETVSTITGIHRVMPLNVLFFLFFGSCFSN